MKCWYTYNWSKIVFLPILFLYLKFTESGSRILMHLPLSLHSNWSSFSINLWLSCEFFHHLSIHILCWQCLPNCRFSGNVSILFMGLYKSTYHSPMKLAIIAHLVITTNPEGPVNCPVHHLQSNLSAHIANGRWFVREERWLIPEIMLNV